MIGEKGFSGESCERGWHINLFLNGQFLFQDKINIKKGEKFILSNKNLLFFLILLMPLFLIVQAAFKIPADVTIVSLLILQDIIGLLTIPTKNLRKNHFCEHYVINKLREEDEKWYSDTCSSIFHLKLFLLNIEYLLARLALADYIYIILFLTFNALLFFYWEKVKRAWQWSLFMAKPEKWRLKLARQQIEKLKKILEK